MIGLVLLTYAPSIDNPRHGYAVTTLFNALEKLKTTDELRVHIADDGSAPEHIEQLMAIAEAHGHTATLTSADRHGYGLSYNLATQECHRDCDFLLMLEDDWLLSRELDLDPLVAALKESGDGCIRLGYLGWTQTLEGKVVSFANQPFIEFSPFSREPHVWTGHPRLETVQFQRRVGPWPEGIDPGSTEFVVSTRDESRRGVLWPLDLVKTSGDLFMHIGAVQARSDQNVL